MANLVLQPVIQAEINHAFAITLYDLSFNGDRPVAVKYGAQGAIGSAKGQEKVSGSFKFAVPVTGLEFDWVALMAAPQGFTVSFNIGAERHQAYGCQVTKRGVTNNPESGDTQYSIDFVATELIRVL